MGRRLSISRPRLRVATLEECARYGRALPPGLLPPIAGGSASYYDTVILEDAPVAFWPLNEPSGTAAADLTGNGHAATYGGGFTLNQTGIGDGETSVAFNGSTGQAVLASAPVTGTPLSMEVWVNLASASLKGAAIKVGDTNGGIGLGIGSGGGTMDNLGNSAIVLFETVGWHNPNVAVGTGWHMLAATYDTSGAGLVVYVDGSSVLTATDNNAVAAANDTYVGGYDPGDGRFLNANTAKAAIYNYALTSTQVAAHYAAKTAPAWRPTRIPVFSQAMWRSAYR